MATEIIGDWQSIKNLVDNGHAVLMFVDFGGNYFVVASNGSFSVSALIDKSNPSDPDLIDFEANYKSSANEKVSGISEGINPSGQHVPFKSTGIDNDNSTAIPLGAGGQFIGEWVDVSNYSNLTVTVFTDQDSAEDGLTIEYSSDGINIDYADLYTINASNDPDSENKQFSFPLPNKYYRVNYTNSGVAQAEFRLQSKLHATRPKPSTHRMNDKLDGQNDVELVKAVLTGKSPNESFENIRADGSSQALSTSTPLSANATFSSGVQDVRGYLTIDFTVLSDQVSATNGIELKWYSDSAGANLIKGSMFSYTNSTKGEYFNIPVQGDFLEILYTNGGTNQSTFQFQTRLKTTPNIGLLSQVEDTLSGDLLSLLTRSILFGRTEAGNLRNVSLANSNSLKVVNTDRPSEVRSRIHIDKNIQFVAISNTPAVVHTVTPGKTLYLTSYVISAINDGNQTGRFQLKDGNTIKIPFIVPKQVTGASTPVNVNSPDFSEPIPFTTDVNVVEISGDITVSLLIVGYEE